VRNTVDPRGASGLWGLYRRCMLTAVALIPGTVLLVPGAAGQLDVASCPIRSASVAAVRVVLESGVDRVVVIAPGSRDRHLVDGWRASLGPVGIADGSVGWPMPTRRTSAGLAGEAATTRDVPIVSPIASAALALVVHAAGGHEPGALEVLEVRDVTRGGEGTDGVRGDQLRSLGRDLVGLGPGTQGAVGLVVAGCLSARNGPGAPLAEDERARGVDLSMAADLADGGPAARARLAGVPEALAVALGITGWAPWQVLVGACGPAALVEAGPTTTDSGLGVTYLSTTWRLRGVSS
jgi:hypothetical protein